MLIQNRAQSHEVIPDFTSARILYYDFFASFLLYELLQKHGDTLQKQIDFLMQFPLMDGDEVSFAAIQKELAQKGVERISSEYTRLFTLPNSPASLYLSYWLEGCNGGESLVMVRNMLKGNSLVVIRDVTRENEDHFGVLCLFMKQLLQENKNHEAREIFCKTIGKIWEGIVQALQTESGIYAHLSVIMKSFFILEESLTGRL